MLSFVVPCCLLKKSQKLSFLTKNPFFSALRKAFSRHESRFISFLSVDCPSAVRRLSVVKAPFTLSVVRRRSVVSPRSDGRQSAVCRQVCPPSADAASADCRQRVRRLPTPTLRRVVVGGSVRRFLDSDKCPVAAIFATERSVGDFCAILRGQRGWGGVNKIAANMTRIGR